MATLPAVVAAVACGESSSNNTSPPPTDASFDSGLDSAMASVPESDASACRPGDVETFQPGPYHSATAPGQGACVTEAFGIDPIQLFYDACLGPAATAAHCSAFKTDVATAACAKCILTSDTDPHFGPLVDHGTFITPNVAGCIELTDPGGLSCAQALEALSGCELAACEANCPVVDATSRDAYDQCASQADSAGCRSFSKAAACVGAESDAGPAAACLASTFVDFYNAVVPFFCGPAPSHVDAGMLIFDASVDRMPGNVRDASSPVDAATADASSGSPPAGDAGEDAHPTEGGADAARDY